MFNEYREAFRSSHELYSFLGIESTFNDQTYPILIGPRLAGKIKKAGPESSLWKQFVPSLEETEGDQSFGLYDPIADGEHSKGSGIIHRYKNRLLFSPTTICPVNCRYCFRKEELSQGDEVLKGKLDQLIEYLDAHPDVDEVILTGGDPLMLSDKKLASIFSSLKDRVPYIRIHSRLPVVMPERIQDQLLSLFSKAAQDFQAFHIAIHANHKDEFDSIAKETITKLKKTGARLLSQSVLLREVNDSVLELKELYETFAQLGVQAYYLHHPDRARGAMHFYLSLEEGRVLYGRLRDELPGWAIPHYIIDPENGQGKNLAYNSESLNYSGRILDRFNASHPVLR